MTVCDYCPLAAFVDIVCILAAFVPYALLEVLDPPSLVQRGFFCDDLSIGLPYKEDTISTIIVLIVGAVAPLALIIFTEIVHVLAAKASSSSDRGSYRLGKRTIDPAIPLMYVAYGLNLFGSGVTVSTTYVMKFLMGSLRPHFLDVCQPNMTTVQCRDVHGMPLYVIDYQCTRDNDKKLIESRRSFPSGHASAATFTMLYVACYVQLRWNWRGSGLLRPLVQAAVVTLALVTSLSRVWDNKHHWWDAMAGFLLGATVAVWMGTRLYAFIKKSVLKPEYEYEKRQHSDIDLRLNRF